MEIASTSQPARTASLKLLTGQSNSPLIVDFLPDPYTSVIVHCELFQCLAYLDEQRIWRNGFTNTPVDGRVWAWSVL